MPFVKITGHAGIRQIIEYILEMYGSVVCKVEITENQINAPRVISVKKAKGLMESKPMEDLWPFLGREEFLSNMMIP